MKECITCKKVKKCNNFYKSIKHKDGYFNICKQCNKEKYISNKEEKIKYQKEYNKNNQEKIQSYNKIYQKNYYKNNQEKIQSYIIKNKDKIKISNKEWREKNKEKINRHSRIKYKEDTQYKLKNILRSRFYSLLKNKKEKSIISLIGCSIEELKIYLEQQFKSEMTWENHGVIWEIDHIKPCISFDLSLEEEQKQCFHYTNLQPLFKTTQIAKKYGYIDEIGNRNKTKLI